MLLYKIFNLQNKILYVCIMKKASKQMNKAVKKAMKELKKQNPVIRVVLIAIGLYVLYYFFKQMRWIKGSNSYLEGLVNSDKTFVFFKMNGCPHCVKMEPEWAKFEKQNNTGIRTQVMEAGANKKEAKKFGVSGFPSLLMISKGKVIDTYNGERNVEGFKKFIAKHK